MKDQKRDDEISALRAEIERVLEANEGRIHALKDRLEIALRAAVECVRFEIKTEPTR